MGHRDMAEPLVTVVRLAGVLAPPAGTRAPAARRALNLERIEPWLAHAFFRDLRPAAVALAVNSPGGAPAQAELIHGEIVRLSKETGIPVFAVRRRALV
jgi:ClpP class serine protease